MNLTEQLRAYQPCCEQEAADRELMLRYLKQFPDDILTRDNPMAHFTASGWVVTPKRDKVLMVYHNIYNSWSWTGGHADGESDLLAVALREVQEETGLQNIRPVSPDIWSLEILGVDAHTRRGKFVSTHLHLNVTYLIEAEDSDALCVKPDENSGVRWFGAADAVDCSNEPEMRVIYRKLMEKLAKSGPPVKRVACSDPIRV